MTKCSYIEGHNSGAVLKRKGSSTPLARLNRGATPARVMLGVTTVLTMTTLISSTNASLPKISYVKSIDAYLAFCFFMVFASLIGELALGASSMKSAAEEVVVESIFPFVHWQRSPSHYI